MEITIYQPSINTIWQPRQVNGLWQACWGGQLKKASKSNDSFSTFNGTNAPGLPFIGGQN